MVLLSLAQDLGWRGLTVQCPLHVWALVKIAEIVHFVHPIQCSLLIGRIFPRLIENQGNHQ